MSNQENLESLKIVPEVKVEIADAFALKLLSPTEIAVLYSLFGSTNVVDRDYNRFTTRLTLKELEEKLGQDFFGANRKFVISKDIIESYRSAVNGTIDVTLKKNNIAELSDEITVSRDRVSMFRSWLNKKP